MRIRNKADEEFQRGMRTTQQHQYVCKHCGHKQLIPNFMDKNLCDWCGYWVFRNDKDEFKFRMSEQMKKKK